MRGLKTLNICPASEYSMQFYDERSYPHMHRQDAKHDQAVLQ